jgi:hypothetical protein
MATFWPLPRRADWNWNGDRLIPELLLVGRDAGRQRAGGHPWQSTLDHDR